MPDTAQLLPPQARLLQLYSGLAMCIVRAVAETLMAMPLAVLSLSEGWYESQRSDRG